MTFRKQWATNWDEVKYCSKACRTRRVRAVDVALETAIVQLLRSRPDQKSICPSEAVSAVGAGDEKALVEPSRMAARRLAVRGVVELTQGSTVVDISTAKGSFRIRRGARFLDDER